MHSWEQHVLCIDIFVLVTYYEVRVFLVGRSFLLALIYRCSLFHSGLAVCSVNIEGYLRSVCLSVE